MDGQLVTGCMGMLKVEMSPDKLVAIGTDLVAEMGFVSASDARKPPIGFRAQIPLLDRHNLLLQWINSCSGDRLRSSPPGGAWA